jgi:hypothetical protein
MPCAKRETLCLGVCGPFISDEQTRENLQWKSKVEYGGQSNGNAVRQAGQGNLGNGYSATDTEGGQGGHDGVEECTKKPLR